MNYSTLKPVRAWSNRDMLSSSWLQCLPGPDGLSSLAFPEAIALTLCMPSPACKDRIGARVGRKTVSIFGDSIMSEILPGDHLRIRHDNVKMAMKMSWARLPVTVEVYGIFSPLIPEVSRNLHEKGFCHRIGYI